MYFYEYIKNIKGASLLRRIRIPSRFQNVRIDRVLCRHFMYSLFLSSISVIVPWSYNESPRADDGTFTQIYRIN